MHTRGGEAGGGVAVREWRDSVTGEPVGRRLNSEEMPRFGSGGGDAASGAGVGRRGPDEDQGQPGESPPPLAPAHGPRPWRASPPPEAALCLCLWPLGNSNCAIRGPCGRRRPVSCRTKVSVRPCEVGNPGIIQPWEGPGRGPRGWSDLRSRRRRRQGPASLSTDAAREAVRALEVWRCAGPPPSARAPTLPARPPARPPACCAHSAPLATVAHAYTSLTLKVVYVGSAAGAGGSFVELSRGLVAPRTRRAGSGPGEHRHTP
jgi:hypothetical protein